MSECQAAACAAARGAVECARSPRLINSVGGGVAGALEQLASQALRQLEAGSPEAGEAVCQLAAGCLDLVGAVDLELLAATAAERPGESGRVVWGFSVEVAEAIAFGLAAVASFVAAAAAVGPPAAGLAQRLEGVCADVDGISVHLYGGLCRGALEAQGGEGSGDEALLVHALQAVCVWSLDLACHSTGSGHVTSEALWEWANGDPLWALVLTKGVMAFHHTHTPAATAPAPLPAPPDLAELKEAVVLAAAGLGSPTLAFWDEQQAGVFADDDDGGATMAERTVRLGMHRARLADAAADCRLVDTLLEEAVLAGGPMWLPAAASMLATLLKPPQGDAALWLSIAERVEAEGSLDVLNLEDAQRAADSLSMQANAHTHDLWSLLVGALPNCLASSARLSFLLDCAVLAYRVPMELGSSRHFLEQSFCLEAAVARDPACLGALCAVAVNCGLCPGGGDPLGPALRALAPEERAEAVAHLARCRAPLREGKCLLWWAAELGAPLGAAGQFVRPPAPPSPQHRQQQQRPASESRAAPPGLRDRLRGAPPGLCCALDGRLLVDPVRSPHGQAFERGNLVRALAANPGLCPITGLPLTLEECHRASDLRAEAARWVRQANPMQRAK